MLSINAYKYNYVSILLFVDMNIDCYFLLNLCVNMLFKQIVYY